MKNVIAILFHPVFFATPQTPAYEQEVALFCGDVLGSQSYTIMLTAPPGSTSITRGTAETWPAGMLVTFNATAGDTGTYQCIATESGSMDSTTLTLDLTVGKTLYMYHLASVIV